MLHNRKEILKIKKCMLVKKERKLIIEKILKRMSKTQTWREKMMAK